MRPLAVLRLSLALALLAVAACGRTPAPEIVTVQDNAAAAQRIRADVRYLADDKLQGRLTGTPGYDLAAHYVARRFAAIGLQPAGDHGGWFQAVPLLRAVREAEGARVAIRRNGKLTELRFREQFLPGLNYSAAEAAVEAPAVFVGHGVSAPELQYDDFAGLDLHGYGAAPEAFVRVQRRLGAPLGDQNLDTDRGFLAGIEVDEDAPQPVVQFGSQLERGRSHPDALARTHEALGLLAAGGVHHGAHVIHLDAQCVIYIHHRRRILLKIVGWQHVIGGCDESLEIPPGAARRQPVGDVLVSER